MIKIELLSDETIPGVVECERASIDKWYFYSSLSEKTESTFEELTPEQRWIHGGPTMDQTLLRKHWMELKRDIFDTYDIYVALEKNRVVGFIGVQYGKEFLLGKHAYVDLLLVHPNSRRKGIARQLLQHVENISKSNDCDNIFVFPDELDGSSGKFYLDLGFEIWEERYQINIGTKNNPDLEKFLTPISEKRESNWNLIFGWHSTSPKVWLMLHSNFAEGIFDVQKTLLNYAFEKDPDVIIGIIKWHRFFDFGSAYLWFTNKREDIDYYITPRHFELIQHIGYKIGLKKVNIVFMENMLPYVSKWSISDTPQKIEPLLRKKL